MGRANVYLSDDLERRVKAARLPISEICQRALLAAVEAAEGEPSGYSEPMTKQFQRGWEAGVRWAEAAAPADLLTLLRDQRLPEIPSDLLPDDLYALTQEQTLAWEAGFMSAARATVRPPRSAPEASDPQDAPSAAEAGVDGDSQAATGPAGLGDDTDCRIGVTLDGDPVSFDPHAAVRAGKSPLFAILGDSEHRARLTLSVAQDAAARGVGVVLLDLSGQLASRATGLGKKVRVMHRSQAQLPGLEEFARGAIGLGGLWETFGNLSRGTGWADLLAGAKDGLVEPGYVTVLAVPSPHQIGTVLSTLQLLTQFGSRADFPRLLHVDLSEGLNIPAGLVPRLGAVTRVARQQNIAVGLSAASADTLARVAGSGAPLSTVIAFASSNPVEADRLRDLMGSGAPVLVNPPGASSVPSDEIWAAMRDLEGRFGQVRMQGW
jgi:hypothetical protein